MVEYGLSVKNANGDMQIDSTYRNLSMFDSGTITMVTDGSMLYPVCRAVISFNPLLPPSNPPLVMWRPGTSGYSANMEDGRSVSGFTPTDFRETSFGAEVWSNPTIDYAVFSMDDNPTTGGYGMQVWNSDGKLCFGSDNRYVQILEIHNIATLTPFSGSVTISHPNHSNPYYILVSSKIGSTSGGKYVEGLKKLSSTSVSVGWFEFIGMTGGVSWSNNTNSTLIVCNF